MTTLIEALFEHVLVRRVVSLTQRAIDLAQNWLTPTFDLALRLYVANVFFSSGWQKLSDWESTVALFQYEYHVPLLPPVLAAAMGAAGELSLPILLVAGLFTRIGAAGLFVVNLVAVLAALGMISDAPGARSTSSKVRPNRISIATTLDFQI